MKRSASNTQLSLKNFMCKARKVMVTAQCNMVPEEVGTECHLDAPAKIRGEIVILFL